MNPLRFNSQELGWKKPWYLKDHRPRQSKYTRFFLRLFSNTKWWYWWLAPQSKIIIICIYIYIHIYMEVSQVMGVPLVIHFFIGCSMKPTSQLGIPISPSCAYRPASTPWRMQRATAASSWTNTLLPSGQGEANQGQMPRATAGDLVVCTYSIIYISYIYYIYIWYIYIYTFIYIIFIIEHK